MKEISCKLLVIGAGPGGYVCAIRAGQLGVDTVLVEGKKPGGTCLNVGCIPSKALIHAADEFDKLSRIAKGKSPLGISVSGFKLDLAKTVLWKDGIVGRLTSGVSGLLKKAGVKVVEGWARFRDGKTVEVDTEVGQQVIRAEQVVIATGSDAVELAALPFGGKVISSTEALALIEVPAKIVVVGAGYIGLELGTAFAKMGAECGGGLALAVGMALSDGRATSGKLREDFGERASGADTTIRRQAPAIAVVPSSPPPSPKPRRSARNGLLEMIAGAKGPLRVGQEGLAEALGVTWARLRQLLKELAAAGAIRVRTSRAGTTITLLAGSA